MGKIGLTLAMVVLVVATVLWMGRGVERGRPELQKAEPVPVASEHEAARLASSHEAPAEVRAPAMRSNVDEEEAPENHIDENAAEEGDTISLAGTIAVVDENGARHETEDGRFELVCWLDQSAKKQIVEVHAGRWETQVPARCERVGAFEIELAGRATVWEGGDNQMLAVPASGWLELLARWPTDSILHVRDRISGRELAPVLVVTIDDWLMGEFGHPGIKAGAARDLGPSPVTLPRNTLREGPNPLFARSPGYAWGRIEIDQARGGERFLLLDQAGELEVEIVGTVSDLGAKLRLYSSEFTPIFEQEIVGETRVSIEDIAPGSYRVTAQVGEFFKDPLVLGEATAEVVAGGNTRVELVLAAQAKRVTVPLAGTLFLPEEWKLDEFQLELELLDTPLGGWDGHIPIGSDEMVVTAPGVRSWKAGPVQPGRYEAKLGELAFSTVFEVGPSGLTDARIEVPPPCEILVTCVDDDTGAEVTSEPVDWHCAIPEGVHGWSSEDSTFDESLRRWRIRAPIGRIRIETLASEYLDATTEIDAHAGTNEVELRLARLTGLTLVLRDGTTEIPWSDSMEATLVPTEGQEQYESTRWGNGSITFLRKAPGAYELRIATIPGYEPIAPIAVRLAKGVVGVQGIELVRVR
jgi:hypothetical protein